MLQQTSISIPLTNFRASSNPRLTRADTIPRHASVLLVTYEYPFGGGETFLRDELDSLASVFSEVVVIPSRAFYSNKWFQSIRATPRRVPENCVIVTPESIPKRTLPLPSLVTLLALLSKVSLAGTEKLPRPPPPYYWWHAMIEASKSALITRVISEVMHRNPQIQLVYSYWKDPSALAIVYLREKRLLRCAVTRCHGGDVYNYVLRYPHRPFDAYIASRADKIYPVSDDGATHLVGLGFRPDSVEVQRLGVRIPHARNQPSRDGILRIVSCGNLIPKKRLSLLACALCEVAFPFSWTHFGAGPERAAIELIARRFQRLGEVKFMGRVANEEVLSHYLEFPVDVFVSVSETEGVPVSIMEAMAAGIPCIATDVGGTAEIVDDTCGKLLKPAFEAASLAGILSSVATEQRHWDTKRANARRRAEERCDSTVNSRHFAQRLLQEAVRGPDV